MTYTALKHFALGRLCFDICFVFCNERIVLKQFVMIVLFRWTKPLEHCHHEAPCLLVNMQIEVGMVNQFLVRNVL